MPLLSIESNQPIESSLLREASTAVASMLSKPESYVMVKFQQNTDMLFAGSSDPLAYLELKSISLPESKTSELSDNLTTLITNKLSIPSDRVYIEFANAERHLWGWNSGTF